MTRYCKRCSGTDFFSLSFSLFPLQIDPEPARLSASQNGSDNAIQRYHPMNHSQWQFGAFVSVTHPQTCTRNRMQSDDVSTSSIHIPSPWRIHYHSQSKMTTPSHKKTNKEWKQISTNKTKRNTKSEKNRWNHKNSQKHTVGIVVTK